MNDKVISMTILDSIKAAVTKTTEQVQKTGDSLHLQAKLGMAEFEDYLEQKRKDTKDAANNLSEQLDSIATSLNETKDNAAAEVDHLKVQVALGKMEGKDSIENAQNALTQYASQLDTALASTKALEAKKVEELKTNISEYIEKASVLKATIKEKLDRSNS